MLHIWKSIFVWCTGVAIEWREIRYVHVSLHWVLEIIFFACAWDAVSSHVLMNSFSVLNNSFARDKCIYREPAPQNSIVIRAMSNGNVNSEAPCELTVWVKHRGCAIAFRALNVVKRGLDIQYIFFLLFLCLLSEYFSLCYPSPLQNLCCSCHCTVHPQAAGWRAVIATWIQRVPFIMWSLHLCQ